MNDLRHSLVLCALLGSLLGAINACSSGDGVRCSFSQPARLANSSWPKFQRDAQNTGAVAAPQLSGVPQVRAQFRDPTGGRFLTGPVLGNGEVSNVALDRRVYIGSSAGQMFALDSESLSPVPASEFSFAIAAAVATTPLVAVRENQEGLFLGSSLGFVYALTQTGTPQPQVWPFNTGGAVGLAVALSPVDGTVYATSAARALYGICPNGVGRFSSTSIAPLASAPAVTPTGEIIYGGEDRILRMERGDGFLLWTLSLSAPLRSAPVIELDDSNPPIVRAVYAVDSNGRLFKVSPTGQLQYAVPLSTEDLSGTQEPLTASPALAGNRLYVPTGGGSLVSVDTATGLPVWSFDVAGALVATPAVLVQGMNRTVVFGATDGNLYFVEDAGEASGAVLSVPVGAPIRTAIAVSTSGPAPVLFVADDSGTVSRIE